MHNREFNQKQVTRYLIFTFGAAYLIQFMAAPLYRSNRIAGQLVLAAMMFVPALGALLCGADLKGMGWKPRIRKNIRPVCVVSAAASDGDRRHTLFPDIPAAF